MMYSLLHDNEFNFGTKDSVPAGAITYAKEREVTWFLMTSNHVPFDCDVDADCRVVRKTTDGYIVFDKGDVDQNIKYFICAHSNASVIEREWYTETVDGFSSCSNGFIIDTIAPEPGRVFVQNSNEFLTVHKDVVLYWDTFTDNENGAEFGYPTGIKEYFISCGILSLFCFRIVKNS